MPPLPLPLTGEQVVLVVDDDPAVCASLKFALEIEGFLVHVFATGEELLAHDALPPAACLVIDYILPKMNGLELLAALRSRGIGFPAILITTDPPPRLRRQAEAAGLALVEKPLLGNGLAEAIRGALATREPEGPDQTAV